MSISGKLTGVGNTAIPWPVVLHDALAWASALSWAVSVIEVSNEADSNFGMGMNPSKWNPQLEWSDMWGSREILPEMDVPAEVEQDMGSLKELSESSLGIADPFTHFADFVLAIDDPGVEFTNVAS
jgi:hypothetical protein